MSGHTLLSLPTETRLQILRANIPTTIRLRISDDPFIRSEWKDELRRSPDVWWYQRRTSQRTRIRLQYFEDRGSQLKVKTLFFRDLMINRQLYTEMCDSLYMTTVWDLGDSSQCTHVLHFLETFQMLNGHAVRYFAHMSIKLTPSELFKPHMVRNLNSMGILKNVRVVQLRLDLSNSSKTECYHRSGVRGMDEWYAKMAAQFESLVLAGVEVHLLFARRDMPGKFLTALESLYHEYTVCWVSSGQHQYMGDVGYVLVKRASPHNGIRAGI